MITVACVLRTGGVFTREWVWALKRGLARNLEHFDFIVLTDDTAVEPYWRVPLQTDWPKWWSKLEVFRPGLFEAGTQVLYLDLDTLPVADLSPIATTPVHFAMLRDFYHPQFAQSGVMMFEPSDLTAAVWERAQRSIAHVMRRYRGDGEFLHAATNELATVHSSAARLQDLFPGRVVSYKVHARQGVPPNALLVCGHGNPRFNTPAAGWAYEQWKSLAYPSRNGSSGY